MADATFRGCHGAAIGSAEKLRLGQTWGPGETVRRTAGHPVLAAPWLPVKPAPKDHHLRRFRHLWSARCAEDFRILWRCRTRTPFVARQFARQWPVKVVRPVKAVPQPTTFAAFTTFALPVSQWNVRSQAREGRAHGNTNRNQSQALSNSTHNRAPNHPPRCKTSTRHDLTRRSQGDSAGDRLNH